MDMTAAVLDSLASSIAVLDARGVIVAVNAAWRQFGRDNGAQEASGVGADYLRVCDQAAAESAVAAAAALEIRQLLHGEKDRFALEYPCHSPVEERWFVVTGTVFEQHGIRHAVLAHDDVTARKRAEDAVRESEQKWRTLFDILPVGVSVLGPGNEILESNPALQRILRITPAELAAGLHRRRKYIGRDGAALAPEELPSARAVRTGAAVHDVEIAVVDQDGRRIWTTVDAAPLPTPRSSAVVVVSDATPRVQAREELTRARDELEQSNRDLQAALLRQEALARTDFLTGAHSRRHFYDIAEQELAIAARYRSPLSVILFDADRFKEINDRHGHHVGDRVLQAVTRAAAARLRAADLLARHGGEEFAVLLPRVDGEGAATVAESIRAAVAATRVESEDGPVAVTISAGVAEALPAGDSLDRLMQRADRALYAAKAAGRDRVVSAAFAGP